MILLRGEPARVVFVLVDAQMEPVLSAFPAVRVCAAGASEPEWVEVDDLGIDEIGAGWYSVDLSEAHTAVEGPLILVAQATGTLGWRDILQVVDAEKFVLLLPGRWVRVGVSGD